MPAFAVGALITGAVSVGVVAATSGFAAVTLATFAVPAAISLGAGLLTRALAPKPSFALPGAATAAGQRTLPVPAARDVAVSRGAAERSINAAITPERWIIGTVRCSGRLVWINVYDDDVFTPRTTVPGGWNERVQFSEDDETTYEKVIYRSLTDDNVGNTPDADTTNWRRVGTVEALTKADTVSSLYMAQVLSKGSLDGIQEIWLDGDKLAVTKTVENGHNVFKADGFELHEYFKADGSEGSECFDAATAGDAALSWSAADVKGEDISWVYIKLTQNDYGSDIDSRRYSSIPSIEFVVKGLKMSAGRDPAGAKVYTENAAIVRKWWLTERRGIDYQRINRVYYRAAVTRCDTEIGIGTLPNFDSSAMQTDLKRYTINGIIYSGDDVTRTEQDMDFAWDGAVVEWDGEFLFRPGGDRTSVKSIVGADILQEPLYRPGTTLSTNKYLCNIPQSEWHDYLPYTLTVDDTGKQRYDGKVQTLDLGNTVYVTNPAQAANILRSAARRARASSSIELTIMPGEDFGNTVIVPGDKVTVNLPELGIADQDYFVLDNKALEGWAMKLNLTEWGSDWFDDTISLDHYSPRQVVGVGVITKPVVTVLITPKVLDDGKFTWYALVQMERTPWAHEIRYKLTIDGDDEWQEVSTFGSSTVITLNEAGEYTFSVRALSRDGRRSAATVVTATADFMVSLPPDPVLARKTVEQGYLRYVFNNLGKFVNGLEIAYNFADIDATAPGNIADADAFEAAEQLGQYTIVPANRLTDERTIVDSIPKIGQFNLYVRARDIAGRYSGIVRLGLETLRLDPPSNVDVDELGDGTRSYTWTLALSEHIAGAVIRYKKAGSHIPTPGPIENAPPTIIAANVTADGDVILAYSEPLDTGSVPAKSRYTVSVDSTDQTPATVTIDTNTVTLTLTTKITVGQDVTVSYRVPNNNPLQDTHDEAAAALTAHAVSNILRDAANEPAWSSMEPLHEGYLASSPYYTKQPGAGIWDIAFRSISRSGRLSSGITYVQVSLAEPVQLDIAEAVKKAIADNPALITLTTEVEAAEAARDRAIKAAQDGEAFRDSAQTFKNAAETAKDAAEQAETNVATALTATQTARDKASGFADEAEAEALKSADSATASAGSATAASGSATKSENEATASEREATASAASATASAASAALAGRSATAAASSASTASTKATEAGTEAESSRTERVKAEAAKDDAESAQAASETAKAAAESAESAAVSAKNSAESAESAATTQATNSANSATASGRSASAAANSASTANTKATEASQSASAAKTSQTKAETAQSGAETAESNAASSATAADGSADAAASSLSAVKASADAADAAKDAAETAKDDAETAEGNASSSATAAAESAKTAKAQADAASTSATAASADRVKAETAKSGAETAQTNAASSETAADGSAKAAAASEAAVAASAAAAKTSADAAATSSQTATAKATEAAQSATAAETAKTAAETAQSSAGTSEMNSSTSATAADGSATAAAASATAAAASAQTATDMATASSASAMTASAKATESTEQAAAALVSQQAAATSEANAKVSETAAAASLTTAQGAAATALLSQTAAAGFADDAKAAVAGITQQVAVEVDRNLRTTYASIVSLRAIAGEAKAKFELVALSDPTGARAAGVITGDLQSFDYASKGGRIDGAYGRAVIRGLEFQGRNVRNDDNGHTIRIVKARSTGSPQPNNKITVSAGTGSSGTTTITLRDNSNNATVSFNRADIARAVTAASTIMRCSGTGTIEIDYSASSNTVASSTIRGGRDNADSTDGTGWIIRRNGTAEFAAASIRGQLTASQVDTTSLKVAAANVTGKLKANQIEAVDADIKLANITDLSSLRINANQITAGTIAASRINADNLQNVKVLFDGSANTATSTTTININDDVTKYDVLEFTCRDIVYTSAVAGTSGVPVSLLGSGTWMAFYLHGSAGGEGSHWVSRSGTRGIRFRAHTGNHRRRIYQIVGIKN